MSKPRLFFVWGYTQWGGAQSYSISIAKRALHRWNVTFVVPRETDGELLQRLTATGAQVEFIEKAFNGVEAVGIMNKLRRQYRRLTTQVEILEHLPRRRIEGAVVHVEAPPWQDWILLYLLCRRGAAVFVTLHNMFETRSSVRARIWRARFRFLSRLRNLHLFVTSKYGLERLQAWVPDALLNRTRVAYPGMDAEAIARVLNEPSPRDHLRAALGVEDSAKVILTVGQFVDRKGPWILLRSAASVIQQFPDAVFLWLTHREPSRAEIERINSFSTAGNFRIISPDLIGEGHDAVLRTYRIADLFVLPSLLEGFPIALTEAMASGLPCISTAVQGIPEAIIDRETGILVAPGDSAALAGSIVELLTDHDLASQLSRNGAAYAFKNFSDATMADEILTEYEQAAMG